MDDRYELDACDADAPTAVSKWTAYKRRGMRGGGRFKFMLYIFYEVSLVWRIDDQHYAILILDRIELYRVDPFRRLELGPEDSGAEHLVWLYSFV